MFKVPKTMRGLCYGKYRGLAPLKRYGIKNVPFYFYSPERIIKYRLASKIYSWFFGRS